MSIQAAPAFGVPMLTEPANGTRPTRTRSDPEVPVNAMPRKFLAADFRSRIGWPPIEPELSSTNAISTELMPFAIRVPVPMDSERMLRPLSSDVM